MFLEFLYMTTCMIAFIAGAVYYMHMFQLNGYHKDGHMKWFCDTLGTSAAKLTPAILSFVFACVPNSKFVVGAVVFNVISVLFFLPDRNAKKPLVFTARIKRLMASSILVFVIFINHENISSEV